MFGSVKLGVPPPASVNMRVLLGWYVGSCLVDVSARRNSRGFNSAVENGRPISVYPVEIFILKYPNITGVL